MTAPARRLAAELGESRPTFARKRDAEKALHRRRDQALELLTTLASEHGGPDLDRSPKSLEALEDWYFDLHRRRGFKRLGTSRAELEACMDFYFGAVATRSAPGARWVVDPFPFAPERYELGVRRGLTTIAVEGLCADWFERPNNARHRALARKLHECFFASAKRRPAPNSTPVDDAMIRESILHNLGRKSTPLVYPGELWSSVQHGLRPAKVLKRRVDQVVCALEIEGLLVRVPLARGSGFRWGLTRLERPEGRP